MRGDPAVGQERAQVHVSRGQGGQQLTGQEGYAFKCNDLYIFHNIDASSRAGSTQREGAVAPSSGARFDMLRPYKGAFRGVIDSTRGNDGTAAVPGRMGPVVVYAVDPATARGAYHRPSQSLTKVTRAGLDRSGGGCPSSGIDPKGGGGVNATALALIISGRS
jgi:hypothetical protein